MTVANPAPALIAAPPLGRRVWRVVRLNLVNKWTVIWIPAMIMLFIGLVNWLIWWIIWAFVIGGYAGMLLVSLLVLARKVRPTG